MRWVATNVVKCLHDEKYLYRHWYLLFILKYDEVTYILYFLKNAFYLNKIKIVFFSLEKLHQKHDYKNSILNVDTMVAINFSSQDRF